MKLHSEAIKTARSDREFGTVCMVKTDGIGNPMYGFLQPDCPSDEKLFWHVNDCMEGGLRITNGCRASYERVPSPRHAGQFVAKSVALVTAARSNERHPRQAAARHPGLEIKLRNCRKRARIQGAAFAGAFGPLSAVSASRTV
jgi:hypothetical protein